METKYNKFCPCCGIIQNYTIRDKLEEYTKALERVAEHNGINLDELKQEVLGVK